MDTAQSARNGAALVVAGDPGVRAALARLVAVVAGWEVDVAAAVDGAAAAVSRRDYDAVLVGVPAGATSAALAGEVEALRASGGRVPMVAVTTASGDEHERRCRAAGVDECLALPVTPEAMADVLARCRGRRSPPVPDAVLDEETLIGLRELGDRDLLDEVVSMFLSQANERLRTLDEAVAVGEAERLAREAHNLKGTSGVVGAARMVALCARLEVEGSSGRVAGAGAVVGRLREEFQLVRAALAAEIDRRRDA